MILFLFCDIYYCNTTNEASIYICVEIIVFISLALVKHSTDCIIIMIIIVLVSCYYL
jgi:hypothetical protein